MPQYADTILAEGTILGIFDMPNDWSWCIPSLLWIAPSVLQLIFIWLVPESPRRLISKDRDEMLLRFWSNTTLRGTVKILLSMLSLPRSRIVSRMRYRILIVVGCRRPAIESGPGL